MEVHSSCHQSYSSLHPADVSSQTLSATEQDPNGDHIAAALPSSSRRYQYISPLPAETSREIPSFAVQPTRLINKSTPNVPRPRTLSSFMPCMPRSSSVTLLSTIQVTSILAAYILHLDWVDAYHLLISCKTTYNSFQDDNLRDVLLSRYVSGYAMALRDRQLKNTQGIPITMHDLDLLLMSQRVPLHRYPMHGLRMLTSLYPTFEDDELTRKLIAFTQVHSRFVLLLQSLVHSSSEPIPLEPEETNFKSRFAPVKNLRELTFPPPLAYERLVLPDSPTVGADAGFKSGHKGSRNRSNCVIQENATLGSGSSARGPGPLPSANTVSSMTGYKRQHWTPTPHKRRLSLFGNPSVAPPPPEEPRTLKLYGSSWRRGATTSHHRRNTVDADEYGYAQPLQRPLRRFASANNSSDSSISDVPVSRDTRENSWNSLTGFFSTSSPHDLHMATSRVRAPVLRAFVPCAKLEDDDEYVVKCERQLEEAGLWHHLSTGDIVCNLGYVPPTVDDGSSEDISPASRNTLPALMPKSMPAFNRSSSNSNSLQRKWLIFDGEVLVPYTPSDLIPLGQPLSLPSPLYYSHIMPADTNPTFTITCLPVCDDVPQFRLVHSTSKVPSPHSPAGYAIVKKYAWTARVVRLRTGDEGDIGDGWFGEWILEYDGTEEGKQTLLDALNGRPLGRRHWEVVRDKSGGGKLCLRLLPIS